MFMTYQPKRDKEKKNMVSEKEWALLQEELFLEKKTKGRKKINSIRAALCGLFSANAGILRRVY